MKYKHFYVLLVRKIRLTFKSNNYVTIKKLKKLLNDNNLKKSVNITKVAFPIELHILKKKKHSSWLAILERFRTDNSGHSIIT